MNSFSYLEPEFPQSPFTQHRTGMVSYESHHPDLPTSGLCIACQCGTQPHTGPLKSPQESGSGSQSLSQEALEPSEPSELSLQELEVGVEPQQLLQLVPALALPLQALDALLPTVSKPTECLAHTSSQA